MVSRELEKECIVVFDEAHNIDNVCIEVSPYGIYSPDRVYHGVHVSNTDGMDHNLHLNMRLHASNVLMPDCNMQYARQQVGTDSLIAEQHLRVAVRCCNSNNLD